MSCEQLERQLLEIEALQVSPSDQMLACSSRFDLCACMLQATYPGEVSFEPVEEEAIGLARDLVSSAADAGNSQHGTPQLGGVVQLGDSSLNGEPVGLHFTLPRAYPDAAPRLQVQSGATG